tara:strand:- start:441 stop:878 length:438 start_codon:yes stop_codon:yes gene_type:complete
MEEYSVFSLACKKKGLILKQSSYSAKRNYSNFSLEGKGKKKSYIYLKKIQTKKSVVWVQIKNKKGEPGWLFGSSDFLVFDTKSSFLIVSKEKMIKFIMKNLDKASHSLGVKSSFYCSSRREGTNEQTTLVPIGDIEKISYEVWSK